VDKWIAGGGSGGGSEWEWEHVVMGAVGETRVRTAGIEQRAVAADAGGGGRQAKVTDQATCEGNALAARLCARGLLSQQSRPRRLRL
jgi:hypothetical protein